MKTEGPVRILLEDMIAAMEDDCDFMQWYLDRETGEVIPQSEHCFSDDSAPDIPPVDEYRRCITIDPLQPERKRRMISTFIAGISDPALRAELSRSLTDRRPLKGFREAMHRHPQLIEQWNTHYTTEMRTQAEEWLKYKGIYFELVTLKQTGA